MGDVQKVTIDEFAQLTLSSCHDNNKMSFIYFHSPSSLTSSDLWRTNIGPNNLASKEQVELHRAGTFPPQNRIEEKLWVNWGRVLSEIETCKETERLNSLAGPVYILCQPPEEDVRQMLAIAEDMIFVNSPFYYVSLRATSLNHSHFWFRIFGTNSTIFIKHWCFGWEIEPIY